MFLLSDIELDDDSAPCVNANGLSPRDVAYLPVHVDSLVQYMDHERIEVKISNPVLKRKKLTDDQKTKKT